MASNTPPTHLTVLFCKALREAGTSLLVQIESQHFMFRTRQCPVGDGWVADVAPVRRVNAEMAEALDVSAYRRCVLDLHGRSEIRKPHEEVTTLPVVEIVTAEGGAKLQVVKYGGNRWITDEEFGDAVNRLGLKTKGKLKKGASIRTPLHASEASKLEHEVLKAGDRVRKRPRSSTTHNFDSIGNISARAGSVPRATRVTGIARSLAGGPYPGTLRSRLGPSSSSLPTLGVAKGPFEGSTYVNVNRNRLREDRGASSFPKLSAFEELPRYAESTSVKSTAIPSTSPFLAERWISVGLGDAEICGPRRFHCDNGPNLAISLKDCRPTAVYVSVPCVKLADLRGIALKDTVEVVRILRSTKNHTSVSFIDDGNLDRTTQREWMVLLGAKRIIRKGLATKELEDRALFHSDNITRDAIWVGDLRLGNMVIPGFRMVNRANGTIFDVSVKGEAKIISVLPPSLSIGALMNSKNELECHLNTHPTHLTVLFCKALREASTSLLVQIESQHFILRTRPTPGGDGWVADVAPVRKVDAKMAEALDVSAYRRDILDLHGRSEIRKPHEEVTALPVVEIVTAEGRAKLQVVKYGGNRWITDEEFGDAVNRLGLKTKGTHKKEPSLRTPVHHSESCRLEHDALKAGDESRKRARSGDILNINIGNIGGTATDTATATPSFCPGTTPRTSRITPGSGSTPFTGRTGTGPASVNTGNTSNPWTGRPVDGKTQASMRMNRRAHLQRQVARRSANARRQTRASASASGRRLTNSNTIGKPTPTIARKYPDSSVVRSLEKLRPFIDYVGDLLRVRWRRSFH